MAQYLSNENNERLEEFPKQVPTLLVVLELQTNKQKKNPGTCPCTEAGEDIHGLIFLISTVLPPVSAPNQPHKFLINSVQFYCSLKSHTVCCKSQMAGCVLNFIGQWRFLSWTCFSKGLGSTPKWLLIILDTVKIPSSKGPRRTGLLVLPSTCS